MGSQRPFGGLIPFEEALATILEKVEPVDEVESGEIDDITDRVLAEDVVSGISVPPFARAAMDGFAVRAEDTYGAGKFDPHELTIEENIHAGEFTERKVGETQAFQIATGAPMPKGADAVVMVENTEVEEGSVSVYKPVHPGENVSPEGEDIEEGETVLKKNGRLTAAKIGALAAIGVQEMKVYKKPEVGIIPTGDEVVPLGTELKPGQIYDVNSYTLKSMIEKNGGKGFREDIVHDTIEGLKGAIEEEAEKRDMVLFSGGSSVGEKDILVDAIREMGEVIFHGVKLKPGKPTLFGKVNGTPVIGMPGYPTSCLNTALQLIRPAIRKMARLPEVQERSVKAVLQKRVNSPLGRQQFMTVSLDGEKAHPAYKQSGAITSIAHADGYFEISENVELVDKGEEIEVILF